MLICVQYTVYIYLYDYYHLRIAWVYTWDSWQTCVMVFFIAFFWCWTWRSKVIKVREMSATPRYVDIDCLSTAPCKLRKSTRDEISQHLCLPFYGWQKQLRVPKGACNARRNTKLNNTSHTSYSPWTAESDISSTSYKKSKQVSSSSLDQGKCHHILLFQCRFLWAPYPYPRVVLHKRSQSGHGFFGFSTEEVLTFSAGWKVEKQPIIY